jgi:hypothetical protein
MNSQTKTSPNLNGDSFQNKNRNIARKLGYILTTTILLPGLKGKSFLDPGFIFAPYVPLVTTPIMPVDNSSASNKAKKMGYKLKTHFSSKKGIRYKK